MNARGEGDETVRPAQAVPQPRGNCVRVPGPGASLDTGRPTLAPYTPLSKNR